jgi:uncharacterized membrane protein
MAENLEAWLAIVAMAAASYFCRAGGFWLMGLVKLTPRLQGWLAAMPPAIVAAILTRTVIESGTVEVIGVATAFLLSRILASDLWGMIAGIVTVAALRAVW